ncbi:hypothetical protein F2Q69_00041664 [Brassica cretica]|uniref:Uncharacterized protein n=1 Tax=Brassica cretica TaxID=69181 RepID=A0A8S9NL10_BRACR|nr:hypothetical protein F2Q69_00041664 [Brassica cretica]
MFHRRSDQSTTLSMSHHISEYDMAEEGDLFKALEKVWGRRRFQPSRLFEGSRELGKLGSVLIPKR